MIIEIERMMKNIITKSTNKINKNMFRYLILKKQKSFKMQKMQKYT